MKFGVRQIADVVFKAKADTKIGTKTFKKGQPVLYIDTATASSLEQAATTVYAQGGRGNSRLIAWEGEKTLTFTVTDALLSPIGFAVLSGAGLFKSLDKKDTVHVHATATAPVSVDEEGKVTIDLIDALAPKTDDEDALQEEIDETAPVFVTIVEEDGSITGELLEGMIVEKNKDPDDGRKTILTGTVTEVQKELLEKNAAVFVDFYIVKQSAVVSELQIDGSNFGGYYYVEASTLFRRQSDGVDMPAEITLPNVKIQSNFTFSLAATGDPSTFDFTMDAFPGYTMFDRKHKVLCVIQIVEDATAGTTTLDSVMRHETGFRMPEHDFDSVTQEGEKVQG